jgi:hypothetical protein
MASRPARVLPAIPPTIPLDALLARAGAIAQPHTRTVVPPKTGEYSLYHVVGSRPTHSGDTPISLLLPVTISHCTCGSLIRTPAPYILIRYAPNAHTVHYRATGPDAVSAELAASLPHERRETHIDIPYCEECF